MTDEVPIHLGEGAQLDGGPYFAAEVTGVHERSLYLTDQEGDTTLVDPEDVDDALSGGTESGEPVRVTGVHPDDAVATIYLPLHDHYVVDVHGGPSVAVNSLRDEDDRHDLLSDATAEGASYHPESQP